MKRYYYMAASLSLGLLFAVVMSGCSTCGQRDSCGQWACSNPFKNRPVRTTVHSWFKGDPCNTCTPPAGQPANCGTNVAPLCDTCGSTDPVGQPVYNGSTDPGIPYYGDPNLNAPMSSPAVSDPGPIYPDAGVQIQNKIPFPSGDIYGTNASTGAITPPNF